MMPILLSVSAPSLPTCFLENQTLVLAQQGWLQPPPLLEGQRAEPLVPPATPSFCFCILKQQRKCVEEMRLASSAHFCLFKLTGVAAAGRHRPKQPEKDMHGKKHAFSALVAGKVYGYLLPCIIQCFLTTIWAVLPDGLQRRQVAHHRSGLLSWLPTNPCKGVQVSHTEVFVPPICLSHSQSFSGCDSEKIKFTVLYSFASYML